MNPRLWFYDQGIWIFPVNKKKEPIVSRETSQFDYRCTRPEAERMGDYGVPLNLLAVADTDSAEAETWVAAHLPDTPFKVTTGRGRHRYYRHVGSAPRYFHRAGLTIEFRHEGQYVVGPDSIHASGVVYTADDWSWNILDLPIFPVSSFEWDDRPLDQRGSTEGGAPLLLPSVIKAGERHDMMFLLMRSLQARGVTDLAVLLKVLHAENLVKCSPPIERRELEKYITRVSRFKDNPGFERDDQDVFTIAGGMLEARLSTSSARTLVKAVEPDFDFGGDDLLETPQPKQPKQPILETEITRPIVSEAAGAAPDMANGHIAKLSLSCAKCGHGWLQKRKDPPKKCPRCRSTLWNREQLLAPDSDDDGEIFDPNEGDDDLEIFEEDDDSDLEVFEEDDEDVEIIDEDE